MIPLSVVLLLVFFYCIGMAYTLGLLFTSFVLFCYGLTMESAAFIAVAFGIYYVVARFFVEESDYA